MSAGSPGAIVIDRLQMRMRLEQGRAQLRQRSHRAACCPRCSDSARRIAQSSRASPGGRHRAVRHLHAAFRVDVDAGFFRVGRARQDHVSAMRAAVAMGADIDDKRARATSTSSAPSRNSHVQRAGCGHFGSAQPAVRRHEADIKAAHARCRGVQHAKAIPAVLDRADRNGRFRHHGQNCCAVRARQRTLTDQPDLPLELGRRHD